MVSSNTKGAKEMLGETGFFCIAIDALLDIAPTTYQALGLLKNWPLKDKKGLFSVAQSFSKVSFIAKFMACLTDVGRSKASFCVRGTSVLD